VLELELVLAEGEAPPFIMDDPLFRLDSTIFLFDDVMPETSVRFPLAAPAVESSLYAPDFGAPGESGLRLVAYSRRSWHTSGTWQSPSPWTTRRWFYGSFHATARDRNLVKASLNNNKLLFDITPSQVVLPSSFYISMFY
jgi:hypothetical protein